MVKKKCKAKQVICILGKKIFLTIEILDECYSTQVKWTTSFTFINCSLFVIE